MPLDPQQAARADELSVSTKLKTGVLSVLAIPVCGAVLAATVAFLVDGYLARDLPQAALFGYAAFGIPSALGLVIAGRAWLRVRRGGEGDLKSLTVLAKWVPLLAAIGAVMGFWAASSLAKDHRASMAQAAQGTCKLLLLAGTQPERQEECVENVRACRSKVGDAGNIQPPILQQELDFISEANLFTPSDHKGLAELVCLVRWMRAGHGEPSKSGLSAAVLQLVSQEENHEQGCLMSFNFTVDHYLSGTGPKAVSLALPCGTDLGGGIGDLFGAALESRSEMTLILGVASAANPAEAEERARAQLQKAQHKAEGH